MNSAVRSSSGEGISLSLEPETRRLGNGLTAFAIPMRHVHRAVICAHLHVGPRFESAEQTGISHFLEHMLYRGTERHPSAHAQALSFERLGGTLAAATYVDHGSMAIAVPPANVDEVLQLFAEVYKGPIYTGIDIEKGIVREEILEALDDDGGEIDADNLIRALCFGAHPLGRPITGTLDHVNTFDEAALREHHRKHYVGSGTVVTIAGAIEARRTLDAVDRWFSDLPSGQLSPLSPPEAQSEARFRYVRHRGSQTALRVGFRAASERDELEPATEMLLRLIDDGMSTRLYHRVCDLRGLCYDVSAAYEAYADSGLVDLAAETAHERAHDVLDELFAVVRDLRDAGPTDEELAKARARCGWQLEESLDQPEEIAEYYGFGELMRVARSPEQRYDQLLSVTRDQVRLAAERTFSASGLNVVAVGLLSKRARELLERTVRQFS